MSDIATIEMTAVRMLAAREHSVRELRDKLMRKHGNAELIGEVLNDLQARGLLSDERFTEQYVGMRIRKGYGPLRIRAELLERGISGELIDLWLDDSPAAWSDALSTVVCQRFGDSSAASQKEQARRARFLQHRGFPESMIRRYLWD